MSNSPRGTSGTSRRRSKTLGPVEDLGAHVRVDWWRNVFNALYLKTDGDVLGEAATQFDVDMAMEYGALERDQRILDLCCGQGRHVLELARRGFTSVEGVDQSQYLIRRARESARREGLGVRFRMGDARAISKLVGQFDRVLMMGNSFGYFENADDDLSVLEGVRHVLREDGVLLLDITDGDLLRATFAPRSWEWIDASMFVCRERWVSPDGRLVSREVITDPEKGVIKDQFYAERLYSRDAVTDLLARAGFGDVTIHRELGGNSTRNQDLGMMAHRLFITAKVGASNTLKRPRPHELVVILGDVQRPDPVKPGGHFGPDDRDTIDRMRIALESTGRPVRILSNHDKLLDDLRTVDNRALVVNLCDEGYKNQPSNELHIPALLDALGLRYTGAGPQCLARCFDKALVRGIARELGIPVAHGMLHAPDDELPRVTRPVIVKPNQADGSFGIDEHCIARDDAGLRAAIEHVRAVVGHQAVLLVEDLLVGKEIGVGILCRSNGPPGKSDVLPIVEEDYSVLPAGLPHICGYRAKWDKSSPYWNLRSIPANLPAEVEHDITTASLRLFTRLECRDYARFDWRLDEHGRACLLEVNPNPGWCWDGHLAKMAALANISYGELLARIVDAAERRTVPR